MSSRYRRALTGRQKQPAWYQVGALAFGQGPLRGTKVRVLEVCGPEPGRRVLLTVHLRGERASREAGVVASLAVSPRPRLLFIHSPAGSRGCGRRPGRVGSSRWGAGGGRDGVERHPPIQRRGWPPPPVLVRRLGGAQGAELCPATPLPLGHWWAASRTPPPFLPPAPSLGCAFCQPDAPGSCRGHLVKQGIIHLNSSSWLNPYAGR